LLPDGFLTLLLLNGILMLLLTLDLGGFGFFLLLSDGILTLLLNVNGILTLPDGILMLLLKMNLYGFEIGLLMLLDGILMLLLLDLRQLLILLLHFFIRSDHP